MGFRLDVEKLKSSDIENKDKTSFIHVVESGEELEMEKESEVEEEPVEEESLDSGAEEEVKEVPKEITPIDTTIEFRELDELVNGHIKKINQNIKEIDYNLHRLNPKLPDMVNIKAFLDPILREGYEIRYILNEFKIKSQKSIDHYRIREELYKKAVKKLKVQNNELAIRLREKESIDNGLDYKLKLAEARIEKLSIQLSQQQALAERRLLDLEKMNRIHQEEMARLIAETRRRY